MSKYGVVAKLVWDGTDEVKIPSEMGKPAITQMQGTALERLAELSGRVCYDSLGKGRSSEDFHKHILEVKHGSVYGHGAVTVKIQSDENCSQLSAFLNRPGVWVALAGDARSYRVTLNPRALLDWDYWTRFYTNVQQRRLADLVKRILMIQVAELCPNILGVYKDDSPLYEKGAREMSAVVPPESDEEKWISLFLSGSRGFSHEMVRHGFRTGISQRSTRYVDEDGSPWLDHPLVQEFWESTELIPEDPDNRLRSAIKALTDDTKRIARETYAKTCETLQKWLLFRGVDKFTARKQARGAARGYLGNALVTELVFSASVAQWKRILRQRATGGADAEIRAVAAGAIGELQASRYGDCFKAFRLIASSDGIGDVAEELPKTGPLG